MATYENQLKMKYLSRYLDSKRRARAILNEIHDLKDLATKITVTFNDMPGGGGSTDKIGAIVANIVDLQTELAAQAKTMRAEQEIVQDVIDAVDDPDLRQLLLLRYINGWKWERIAVDMNYSWRHTLRLHGAALSAVKIPNMSSNVM